MPHHHHPQPSSAPVLWGWKEAGETTISPEGQRTASRGHVKPSTCLFPPVCEVSTHAIQNDPQVQSQCPIQAHLSPAGESLSGSACWHRTRSNGIATKWPWRSGGSVAAKTLWTTQSTGDPAWHCCVPEMWPQLSFLGKREGAGRRVDPPPPQHLRQQPGTLGPPAATAPHLLPEVRPDQGQPISHAAA